MNTEAQTPLSLFWIAAWYPLHFLSRPASSIRGCPTKLDRLSSADLVFSKAHCLVLIVALTSSFTNFLRFMLLFQQTSARIPRIRALCTFGVSSPSCRANTFSRIFPLCVFSFTCSSSLDTRQNDDSSLVFLAAGNAGFSRIPDFDVRTPP